MGGPGFLSLPRKGTSRLTHIPVPKEFQTASGEADRFFFGKTKNRSAGFQNFNPIVPRGRDRFGRTFVNRTDGLVGGSFQFVPGTGRELAPDGPAESSARGINVDLRTDPETSTDRASAPDQGGTGITAGSAGGRRSTTLLDDPNGSQITILGE